jgi:hypothetical protein
MIGVVLKKIWIHEILILVQVACRIWIKVFGEGFSYTNQILVKI